MADPDYTNEIWKVIPHLPDYAISDFGRVKRIAHTCGKKIRVPVGSIIKFHLNPNGYPFFRAFNPTKGKVCNFTIHRVMGLTFFGDPPFPDAHVAHNDGNPLNRRLTNLRWATCAENQADKVAHGTSNRGERCGSAKLTEADIRDIRVDTRSAVEIAEFYGVHPMSVSRIKRRATWKWLL